MDVRRNYLSSFVKRYPSISSSDLGSRRSKRSKVYEQNGYGTAEFPVSWRFGFEQEKNHIHTHVLNDSAFTTKDLLKLNQLDSGKWGSVTKEIEDVINRRRQLVNSYHAMNPDLRSACVDVKHTVESKSMELAVIDLDDEEDGTLERFVPEAQLAHHAAPVVIIDSDDDNDDARSGVVEVGLKPPPLTLPSESLLVKDIVDQNLELNETSREADVLTDETKTGTTKDKGEYVGTDDLEEDDESSDTNSDGLGCIWDQMTRALECSKDAYEEVMHGEYEAGDEEDCEHYFILKDDIGDVCRICGVIKRGIETIIEYNFSKNPRTTRTYKYEGRSTKDLEQAENLLDGITLPNGDFTAAEINAHPRHRKQMKPHQIEGFNFLLSNLVADNPGGCILAHAPGSGKTFMIISFLQSFMAKYPDARILVVLPRGIISVWKKEFLRWQVEDLPLYDFYSVKADSRPQQLEVLKKWVKERSILFLGYKQFSSIFSDNVNGQVAVECQNYLVKVPTVLILDEGHTPRNKDTDISASLERVETTRKVVLSGTLYQNHVEEVFNVLNLVRPKFLKTESSKTLRRRILSRAEISSRRNLMKHDNDFYELIERTLTKDENQIRKATIIQDLREMTKGVLHYYRGDNLDELPGLVEFSVFVKLSPKQKAELKALKGTGAVKFVINAQGSSIYLHPMLKALVKNSGAKERVDEEKINALTENLIVKEGAKLNFYLNLLQLCISSGEKLLVFSQYLLPLKFLERITAKRKGYSLGKEMFMITGDADTETRESYMEKFNHTPEARVFFGSIKACGEGISLVGASRIIILDIHLNPSVTRQAIGRAFRPGQLKKVYVYRLIASDSPEEEDHATSFRKESISKLWFEWDERNGPLNFDMETVDINNSGDEFFDDPRLKEDVVSLFKSILDMKSVSQ